MPISWDLCRSLERQTDMKAALAIAWHTVGLTCHHSFLRSGPNPTCYSRLLLAKAGAQNTVYIIDGDNYAL